MLIVNTLYLFVVSFFKLFLQNLVLKFPLFQLEKFFSRFLSESLCRDWMVIISLEVLILFEYSNRVRMFSLTEVLSNCRLMAQFQNDDLEYVVDDYFDMASFEDSDDPFAENQPRRNCDFECPDSDFEDDFEMVCLLWFPFLDFGELFLVLEIIGFLIFRASQRRIPLLWKLGMGKTYKEYRGRGLIIPEIITARGDWSNTRTTRTSLSPGKSSRR